MAGYRPANQVLLRHFQAINTGILEQFDMTRGDATTFFDNHFLSGLDVERSGFATQTFGHQLQFRPIFGQVEHCRFVEDLQHLLVVVTQRAEQDRRGQLAATIDAHVQVVLRVKLEVQPGTTVWNHPCGVEQLARTMGLALVVIEEHARRTVQLRNDHALRAIDDERAVVSHERQFAHVDLLLTHILDGFRLGVLVVDDQAHHHAQRRGVGHAANTAFLLIKHRITEPIAHVLECSTARIARHREDGIKGCVQPGGLPLLRRQINLQELTIGIDQRREQEGDFQRGFQLAEILANSLLLGERVSHALPRLTDPVVSRKPLCVITSLQPGRPPAPPHPLRAMRNGRNSTAKGR